MSYIIIGEVEKSYSKHDMYKDEKNEWEKKFTTTRKL